MRFDLIEEDLRAFHVYAVFPSFNSFDMFDNLENLSQKTLRLECTSLQFM